jgi:hypothetical protein
MSAVEDNFGVLQSHLNWYQVAIISLDQVDLDS